MVKQTVIHSYHGVLLSNKTEQTIDMCNNFDGSQRHYAEKKKKTSKDHKWYDSIYVIVLKRHIYRDGEEISGCQGSGIVGRRQV